MRFNKNYDVQSPVSNKNSDECLMQIYIYSDECQDIADFFCKKHDPAISFCIGSEKFREGMNAVRPVHGRPAISPAAAILHFG